MQLCLLRAGPVKANAAISALLHVLMIFMLIFMERSHHWRDTSNRRCAPRKSLHRHAPRMAAASDRGTRRQRAPAMRSRARACLRPLAPGPQSLWVGHGSQRGPWHDFLLAAA